jgi:hypothetical protein
VGSIPYIIKLPSTVYTIKDPNDLAIGSQIELAIALDESGEISQDNESPSPVTSLIRAGLRYLFAPPIPLLSHASGTLRV